MGQTDRLYQLKNWLDSGRCLTRDFLLERLEISPATLKRDLALLRNRLNAPVVFEKERQGWKLDPTIQLAGTQYELPGLWISSDEMQALRTMQHLLAIGAGSRRTPGSSTRAYRGVRWSCSPWAPPDAPVTRRSRRAAPGSCTRTAGLSKSWGCHRVIWSRSSSWRCQLHQWSFVRSALCAWRLSWFENKTDFGHPALTFDRGNGAPVVGLSKTIFCPKRVTIPGRRFRRNPGLGSQVTEKTASKRQSPEIFASTQLHATIGAGRFSVRH